MTKLAPFGLALVSWLVGVKAVAAEVKMTLTPDSSADFSAIGKPGFLRINGEGGKPQGSLTLDGDARLVSADVRVPLTDLKTGIDLRDQHMKEKYLEVAKYSDATFHAGDVKLPGNGLPKTVKVPGSLTIHGVTKPVELELSLSRDGNAVSGETDFEVKLSDFGIDIPSFMGVTVAETVKIHSKFKAK